MTDPASVFGRVAYQPSFPEIRTSMDKKELFYRQFQAAAASLQDQISQLGSVAVAGGERQDAIETVLAGISRLSNEVADASDYVPAYDQRLYSEAIRALTDQLNAETAKLAPKKSRFQFKPRGATSAEARKDDPRRMLGRPDAEQGEADAAAALPAPGNHSEEPSASGARDVAIAGHAGLHILLPASASRATSSGSLADLRGCVVDMVAAPAGGAGAAFAGLALKGVERSLVVAGRVDGPAHVTGVRDSVLVVAARQVRIHECRGVDVYLHCASHPIIEDCTGMRFAPLPACYVTPGIDPENNQWDQVDDFKWLKAEHSPNWEVLPEGERIPDKVWREAVPGGPGVGVEDILKAVGISSK